MSRRVVARPRYSNAFLILGVAGLVAGGVLLLWNFGYLPQPGKWWPIPVLVAGLLFLYMAWPRRHSDTWIIPGMVLTLGGVLFLLANTVLEGQNLEKIWPLFMLVTGISLIPYALRKKGSSRTAIIVPGVFISLLSLFFLPFSLHREEGGLIAFVRQWWPLILVVLGVTLIISFFSTRRPTNKV